MRGEIWYAGECSIPKDFKKILVIEDSLCTGTQLKVAVEKLKDFKPDMEVKTASLFLKTGHNTTVDYVLVQHDCWTIGEWNLLTSLGFMGRLGVDLDGVLGEDCPTNVDDDGVLYRDWLSLAKPLFIPQFKVDAVITSRLEKYRPETEAWLKRHGVRYKELMMLDLPSVKERTFNVVVRHKANAIRRADLEWYWESNWNEAEQIHRKTKLPILCTSNMRLVGDPRKIAPLRLETKMQASSFERVHN